MPARDFGGLIRQRRERLGLSSARVAELVGRAPGTIKNWERGQTLPTDSAVITSLAVVLDIDEGDLFEAVGLARPVEQPTITMEESLASIAPRRAAEADAAPDSRPVAPSSPAGDGSQVPRLRVSHQGSGAVERVVHFFRNVREQMAAAAERSREADRAAPPPVPQPIRPASPSYLEDPDQRLTYRMRGVYTAIGVAVAFIVLMWAGAHALEALGQTWDSLLGGF